MVWILDKSIGADEIIPTITATNVATTIFAGDGVGILATFTAPVLDEYQIVGSVALSGDGANDTLLATSGRDFILWDNTTSAANSVVLGMNTLFEELSQAGNAAIEVFVLGAGDDIINLTHSTATGGTSTINTSYAANVTIYGGTGSDLIAAGVGDDRLFGGDPSATVADTGGNDTIFGGTGNDFIDGALGTDTLYGGGNNDTLIYSADSVIAADGDDFVRGWDGESGSFLTLTLVSPGDTNWSADLFFGGNGTDTVILSGGRDLLVLNTDDILVNGSAQANNPNRLNAIEVVLAGAGADIVMATDPDGLSPGTGSVYAAALTIAGQTGFDTLIGGSAGDLLVGGNLAGGGITNDNDLLFGGAGGDVIWGDLQGDVDGASGGNDTIYGGSALDTMYGGGGNDVIVDGLLPTAETDIFYGGAGDDTLTDFDSGDAYGGDGADLITLHQNKLETFNISGGNNAAGDGADRVIITGSYDTVVGGLGLDDDSYIANATGAGALTDIIDGEDGNDVISSWAGADTLSGGDGTDVLWGGAGQDVLFGGADTDFLYAQEGNDTIYGGTGWDMIYFGRNDGTDLYFDNNDVLGDGLRENWIVVYGVFNQAGDTPGVDGGIDYLLNGAGVRETDYSLAEAIGGSNMAQLTGAGTDFTLTVARTGFGTSSISFDSRDVAGVALWDNDALDGHVIQVYLWNGSTYAYAYSV